MRLCPTCERPRTEGSKTCSGCGREFPGGLASLPDIAGFGRAPARARSLWPRPAAFVAIAIVLVAGGIGAALAIREASARAGRRTGRYGPSGSARYVRSARACGVLFAGAVLAAGHPGAGPGDGSRSGPARSGGVIGGGISQQVFHGDQFASLSRV